MRRKREEVLGSWVSVPHNSRGCQPPLGLCEQLCCSPALVEDEIQRLACGTGALDMTTLASELSQPTPCPVLTWGRRTPKRHS